MMIKYKAVKYAAIILLAFLSQCGSKEQQMTPSPNQRPETGNTTKGMIPLVAVSKVELSTVTSVLQLTGSVEPVRIARLASPVEGPIQTLWAREGDSIKAGKVLVDIGRKSAASAQLAAAREYMQKQEQELKRIKKLVNDGAIAESELDAAHSQYENARAQYARAGEVSGDFKIRAPWSGIVAKVLAAEGDFVAPRSPLIEIYDPSTLVVKSSVPESRATKLHQHAPVKIRFDALAGHVYDGSVSRIFPQLDPKTRTRAFEVTIHDSVELIPGMFSRLEVQMAKADSALVIPENAIVTTPKGESIVFVIENKATKARSVTIGIRNKKRVQIKQGLQVGEMIVVAGNEKLKNGSIVRIAQNSVSGSRKGTGPGNKNISSDDIKQPAQKKADK